MAQRIKGQEVTITIVSGGTVEDSLTEILNFNVEPLLETKEQGYLGETTNRSDDIYNGCRFDLELHLHNQDWLKFQKKIIDRARRLTPDVEFVISATLLFPNGESPVVTLPDCKFGSTPMNITSRGDYVKVKLQGRCDDFDPQLS